MTSGPPESPGHVPWPAWKTFNWTHYSPSTLNFELTRVNVQILWSNTKSCSPRTVKRVRQSALVIVVTWITWRWFGRAWFWLVWPQLHKRQWSFKISLELNFLPCECHWNATTSESTSQHNWLNTSCPLERCRNLKNSYVIGESHAVVWWMHTNTLSLMENATWV